MDYFDISLKIVLGVIALFGVGVIVKKVSIRLKNYSMGNVGRDKVVINNYNFPVVGLTEKLLSEDPLTIGLYEVNITRDKLDIMGIFFNEVYEKVRIKRRRQVTRNAPSMLCGAMFAIGTKGKNIEWKEHCASSLREILHEWDGEGYDFTADFREFYPNSPKAGETEAYRNLKLYYGYFSGIGHHDASGIMNNLSNLKKSSTLKLEDCYKDEIFVETVKKFLELVFEIVGFSKRNPVVVQS